MFIAALSTIAKKGKQPKCPPAEEWIKKMWYIYTIEYYLAIKKNEIMPFEATWMDLESVMLSEVSQTGMIGHNSNVATAFLLSFAFCQSCLFICLRKETP